MKSLYLTVVLMFLALILAVGVMAAAGGCGPNNQPASAAELTNAIVLQAQIIRTVVASQPPGAKRDKLLAEIDQAILAGNLIALEEKLIEARNLPTTAPVDPLK